MQAKKKVPVSIAMSPDLRTELRERAKRHGVSLSSFLSDLGRKALDVHPEEDIMVCGRSRVAVSDRN